VSDRSLRREVVIRAPLDRVWRTWTTEAGLAAVFGPCRVELEPGGDYSWFLRLEPDDRGLRGSEGSRIVSFDPERELVFDWTFPPETPGLRRTGATTRVMVTFEPAKPDGVLVRLVATGWGTGEEWELGYRYFEDAWGWVFQAIKQQLEAGAG
jgi:uncharacterized protein YndB with AHSA1/START domain